MPDLNGTLLKEAKDEIDILKKQVDIFEHGIVRSMELLSKANEMLEVLNEEMVSKSQALSAADVPQKTAIEFQNIQAKIAKVEENIEAIIATKKHCEEQKNYYSSRIEEHTKRRESLVVQLDEYYGRQSSTAMVVSSGS